MVPKRVAVVAVLVCLSGCASTFGNDTSVGLLNLEQRALPETSATIIFSAGVRQTCFSSYPVMIDLIEVSSGETIEHFTANNELIKPQLDENHGFLHASNVAPGEYLLTLDVWTKNTVSAPVARLTLAPNDLVYLGEFFIDSGCAGFASRDTVFIRDRRARDLAKAAELNPAIDPAQVQSRVLRFEDQTEEIE